jgi:hypothetical protein
MKQESLEKGITGVGTETISLILPSGRKCQFFSFAPLSDEPGPAVVHVRRLCIFSHSMETPTEKVAFSADSEETLIFDGLTPLWRSPSGTTLARIADG